MSHLSYPEEEQIPLQLRSQKQMFYSDKQKSNKQMKKKKPYLWEHVHEMEQQQILNTQIYIQKIKNKQK